MYGLGIGLKWSLVMSAHAGAMWATAYYPNTAGMTSSFATPMMSGKSTDCERLGRCQAAQSVCFGLELRKPERVVPRDETVVGNESEKQRIGSEELPGVRCPSLVDANFWSERKLKDENPDTNQERNSVAQSINGSEVDCSTSNPALNNAKHEAVYESANATEVRNSESALIPSARVGPNGIPDARVRPNGIPNARVRTEASANSNKFPSTSVYMGNWTGTLKTESGTRHFSRKDISDRKLVNGLPQLEAALHNLSSEDSVAPVLESYREILTKDVRSWLVINLSRSRKRKTSMKVLEWLSDSSRGLNVNAYNSLITGLIKDGKEAQAINVFERMKADGVAPTLYTYTAVMRAKSQLHGWEAAHRMFSELVINGNIRPDVVMYNVMLGAYGRGSKLQRVLQTWDRMQQEGCQESISTYCLLLSIFVQNNQIELALDVYARILREGLEPTEAIYRGLVCVCAADGRWVLALDFFQEMLDSGSKPTIVTYNVLMRAVGKAGKWHLALDLLEHMKTSGISPDFYTVNAVLNGLIAAEELERAMEFFTSMKALGVKMDREVYNVMLVACQKMGNWEEALEFIKEMQRMGITPNEVTFGPLIMACEHARQTAVALQLYEYMKQVKCTPNTHVVASLIRICGRELMWQEGSRIYEDFCKAGQKPNVYVYNALIDAYCRSEKFHLAMQLDRWMKEEGCERNHVTISLSERYYKKLYFY